MYWERYIKNLLPSRWACPLLRLYWCARPEASCVFRVVTSSYKVTMSSLYGTSFLCSSTVCVKSIFAVKDKIALAFRVRLGYSASLPAGLLILTLEFLDALDLPLRMAENCFCFILFTNPMGHLLSSNWGVWFVYIVTLTSNLQWLPLCIFPFCLFKPFFF